MSSSENLRNSFYQVDIIEALFFDQESRLVDYVSPQYFQSEGCYYYKNEQGDKYLLAQAIGEAAVKLNKYLLAEICKLKREDVLTGVADKLLESVTRLTKAEQHTEDDYDMSLTRATPPFDLHPVKPEPESPPPNHLGTPPSERTPKRRLNNPMSLDQLVSEQAQESDDDTLKRRRLAPDSNERPQNGRFKQTKSEERIANGYQNHNANGDSPAIAHPQPLLPRPSNPGTPTLLSKRLTPRSNKNARNLTIYAPSYAEQHALGIKSAPLHATHQQSARHNPNKNSSDLLHPRHGHTLAPLLSPRAPIVASQRGLRGYGHSESLAPKSAANAGTFPSILTSSTSSPRKAEFPIPPVVPSQQVQHYQNIVPIPSVYGPMSARSASDHTPNAMPSASTPGTAAAANMPPKTPTTNSFASLQKQSFLQPFEHLFENIEITRTLKSTLDDQVRRSSSLMQSLQSHNSMVENMVKNHMKEIQREISDKIDQRFDEVIHRISALESSAPDHRESSANSSTSSASNTSRTIDASRQPDTTHRKKK
ncbi:hypothetical protein BC943DRAFT_358177 [Umbelopsis sp. AD052]|nr:hypothetical protein BC943DRAFT_358177 [Umbelopsis sp. AD052]